MGQQPVKESHASNKTDQKPQNEKLPRHRNFGLNLRFWVENPIAVIATFVGGIFLSPITNFPGGNPKHLWYVAVGICIMLNVAVIWVFSSIIDNLETPNAPATGPAAPTAIPIAAPAVQIQPDESDEKTAAKTPDDSAPKDNDTKPIAVSEPIQPHENPTLSYIAKVLSQHSGEERELVVKQFIGTPVSWDGRTSGISTISKQTRIRLLNNLADEPYVLPLLFYILVDQPQNMFLLKLSKGSPIHVEGTIATFEMGDVPVLKDATVKLLPATK